jgi:acetoin:2,6-dichlorophenolindophenol oxidoreductase subunit beta
MAVKARNLLTQHITFKEAVNRALTDEMAADKRVFVFGLDVSDHKRIFGSTVGLVEKFGAKRCFGTPLSEDAMTGVALGAALSGLRPVHIHIRVDFLLLAMNQIANMISCARYTTGGKVSVPLVIRAVIGRGWGQGAQHSKTLQNIFAHIPGLKVIMPTNPQDAYSLTRSAIQDESPVIILEHRWLYDGAGEVDFDFKIPLGRAIVKREGKDISVVTTSWMLVEAMKAREILEKRGVFVEIVDVRSLAPLDSKTIISSVEKTRRCIVADYDWVYCGFGAEVAAQIYSACFGKLKSPIERLGFKHTPCPTTRPLENQFYPSAVTVVRAIEKILGLSETDVSGEELYSWENRFKGPF